MYSGVIGLSWVYKSVSPSVLNFVYERRLYLVSAQETRLNCLSPCCNGWCTRIYGIFDHRPWNLGVLILVVMDDALARVRLLACSYWTRRVLILVVMDDVLAPLPAPSCAPFWRVLILVVMDDALALFQSLFDNNTRTVLILVVMDDALAPYIIFMDLIFLYSLNPCCNGWCTRT